MVFNGLAAQGKLIDMRCTVPYACEKKRLGVLFDISLLGSHFVMAPLQISDCPMDCCPQVTLQHLASSFQLPGKEVYPQWRSPLPWVPSWACCRITGLWKERQSVPLHLLCLFGYICASTIFSISFEYRYWSCVLSEHAILFPPMIHSYHYFLTKGDKLQI